MPGRKTGGYSVNGLVDSDIFFVVLVALEIIIMLVRYT